MSFDQIADPAGFSGIPLGKPQRSLAMLGGIAAVILLSLLAMPPADAHHLMGMFALRPGPVSGLLSGLGHPVLGPDHLLFLLSMGLVGLRKRFRWVVALVGVALMASLLGMALPGLPGLQVLVPLSLILVALVTLGRLPTWLLLPAAALHGYALSEAVLGWEPTPLAFYLLGLLISQSALLLVAVTFVRRRAEKLGTQQRWLAAGLLMGLGLAFAWSGLVA